jgi:hypothetical protein
MKKEFMLFLGLSAVSFLALEVGPFNTGAFNFLVYQELKIAGCAV